MATMRAIARAATTTTAGLLSLAALGTAASAETLFDVDFESYSVGALNGQSGGVMEGAWGADPAYGDFRVIDAFPQAGSPSLGNKAVTVSRSRGGGIAIGSFTTNLDTMAAGGAGYFAVDFYRGDDDDRISFNIVNNLSGAQSGLGFEFGAGPDPLIGYALAYPGGTVYTNYTVENQKWHRVEFEFTTGQTINDRVFNLFVQKEGVAGRTQIVTNANWDIWNQNVNGIWLYPLGLTESVTLVDNPYVASGVTFPVNRPLLIGSTGEPAWNIDGSGDWNVASNWASGAVPNGAGSVAILGSVITSAQTVFTNTATTVGTLKFDNANMYTLGGGGSLTIDVSSGSGAIQVVQGSHRIEVPLNINATTTADVAGAAGLTIASPLVLAPGSTLHKLGGGMLEISAAVSATGAASLNVSGGAVDLNAGIGSPASTTAAASTAVALIVSGNKVKLGAGQTLSDLDVQTSAGGDQQVDLAGNSIRIYNGSLAASEQQVYDAIKSARLSAGGIDGIYDSTKPVANYAVGVTDQSADAHGDVSLLVKLTREGDANVDGVVNVADLGLLATSWQQPGLWDNGDFDYSGTINVGDLGILATNWQQSASGPALAEALVALGLPAVSVPEPAMSLGLLCLALSSLRQRRTR